MATMALPIRDLESLIRNEAKPKTACVAKISKSNGKGFATVCKIAALTLGLKFLLGRLARWQGSIIASLVKEDFNSYSSESLTELAKSIDQMVADEREALEHAYDLGYELRAFWPLDTLQEQIEHLDSIAESLHLAADPEGTALLSLAVEQVAVR